jgi:hypothetical protein
VLLFLKRILFSIGRRDVGRLQMKYLLDTYTWILWKTTERTLPQVSFLTEETVLHEPKPTLACRRNRRSESHSPLVAFTECPLLEWPT